MATFHLYGHFKSAWDHVYQKASDLWEVHRFGRQRSPLEVWGIWPWFISQSEHTRALMACILCTREMQRKNELPEELMGNYIIWFISWERNLELKKEIEYVFL